MPSPYMSGSTLLTAVESAKGVTFAGHSHPGTAQHQPPVRHTSGGGGGGGSSSSEPSVLGSFGLGLRKVPDIVNGLQDMAIGLATLRPRHGTGIGMVIGKGRNSESRIDPVYGTIYSVSRLEPRGYYPKKEAKGGAIRTTGANLPGRPASRPLSLPGMRCPSCRSRQAL